MMHKESHLSLIRTLTGAALLVAASVIFLVQQTQAQEVLRNFTVTPPTEEITIDPGGYKEGVIKIINDGPETQTLGVGTQDFVVSDTNGTPNLIPPNTLSKKYSATAWLGIDPSIITVKPGQRKELHYYLQVPPDARPGGHYAAVIYTPTKTIGVQGTGTAVQTQIGTLFLITVKGPIHEQANVSKFSTRGFFEYGPITINTQIKNMGDLHIKPAAYITVYNMFGKASYTIALDSHNIFPEAARDFSNTFGRKLMFGQYKAQLVGSYGLNNNLPLTAMVTFWVFPWKIAVLVILVIVAAVLAMLYLKKRDTGGTQNHTEQNTEATQK